MVVAGGYNGEPLDDVETWVVGSSDEVFTMRSNLPKGVSDGGSTVSKDGKSLIIAGGATPANSRNIYRVFCPTRNTCEAIDTEKTMKIARSNHIAMLIPDELATCQQN